MKRLSLIIIVVLIGYSGFGQGEGNPPIVTDRPDQTESAVTVPHKSLQIESGFTFGWDKQDGISSKDLGYNSTLLRYGVLRNFEVRLNAAYAGAEIENEILDETTSAEGFAPLVIGLKWSFLEGDGPIPTMAFLTHVDLPKVASKDLQGDHVLHSMVIAGSWDLSNVFSFGFNFGERINWKDSDFTTLYTAALGISITQWLGAFVELYGFLPAGEYSDHRFDMGFTFPVRNNLQFDISGGMGISKNSPDGFGSIGFAWRIPN